jgi:hypothetical protein
MAFTEAQIARKKVLENPFNASHRNIDGNEPWAQSESTGEIRAELKRRGLPYSGIRSELVRRLKEHNSWIRTSAGMQEIHQRKLDVFKKQKLTEIVPFYHFPRFPIEIRLMIWEFSLSGPRTLSVSDWQHHTGKLHFRKNDNQLNPAALSTCQESRSVALKRYRLCFGTPNVYADLPGGDILHFGQSYDSRASGNYGNLLKWSIWDASSVAWVNRELENPL